MKAIPTQTIAGKIVYIEISDDFDVVKRTSGGGIIAGQEEMATSMMERLQDVGTTIADVCCSIQEKAITTLDNVKPKELTLQFGIKLGGEAGVPFITKGSVEGTFQVTVKWEYK